MNIKAGIAGLVIEGIKLLASLLKLRKSKPNPLRHKDLDKWN